MNFYLRGMAYGLGSVTAFYITLRYFLPSRFGMMLYVLAHSLTHPTPQQLTATAGGSSSLFGYVWFWLWSMILFAGTLLAYLRFHRVTV